MKVDTMHFTTFVRIVLGVLGVVSNLNASLSAEPVALGAAAQLIAKPEILVIAHRGDSKIAPENTLPAFASAVKAGADLVELDYYNSADGIPVVFHDDELDRTSDAVALWGGSKIKITSKRLDELKVLDAGKWFDAKFAGTRIPTLAEALDTIQAGSTTLIERKGGDPATCIALLKKMKLLDKVVVQSFDWDYLSGCHALDKNLAMAALGHEEFTTQKLDQIAKTGVGVVAWQDKYTSASTIAAIHARGYKAWVWTVDDQERVKQLAAAKIDGIITNLPAQTRATLQASKASRK